MTQQESGPEPKPALALYQGPENVGVLGPIWSGTVVEVVRPLPDEKYRVRVLPEQQVTVQEIDAFANELMFL